MMITPMALPINAFDATKSAIFSFNVVGGNQVVKNRLVISKQSDGTEVYNQQVTSFSFSHEVPANTLDNGEYYNFYFITYDVDNNDSDQSNTVAFYCYTEPTLTISDLSDEGSVIINNSSYTFGVNYDQIEGELLNGIIITLYDSNGVEIENSGLLTNTNTPPLQVTHTFNGFINNTTYKIQASGTTVNGTEIQSPLYEFIINYSDDISLNELDLFPDFDNGRIRISSNIIEIEGNTYAYNPNTGLTPSIPVFTDNGLDLTVQNVRAIWNKGFTIPKDFQLQTWFKSVRLGRIIKLGENIYVELFKNTTDNKYYAQMYSESNDFCIWSNGLDEINDADKLSLFFQHEAYRGYNYLEGTYNWDLSMFANQQNKNRGTVDINEHTFTLPKTTSGGSCYTKLISAVKGDTFTISVDVKTNEIDPQDNKTLLYVRETADNTYNTESLGSYEYLTTNLDNEWKRVSLTYTVKDEDTVNIFVSLSRTANEFTRVYRYLKVQKGSVATPYTNQYGVENEEYIFTLEKTESGSGNDLIDNPPMQTVNTSVSIDNMFPMTQITLFNGIYRDLYMTKDIRREYTTEIPTDWDIDTIFNCGFNNTLNGGNTDIILSKINGIKIKRKKENELKWITLKRYDIKNITDFNIVFYDYLIESKQTYTYAIVPVLSGEIEGNYITQNIEAMVNGVFISDNEHNYKLYMSVNYGNAKRNLSRGSLLPINNKYPIVIENSANNYIGMTTSANILGYNFETTRVVDRYDATKQINDIIKFLSTDTFKVLRDWNGNTWIIKLTGSPSVKYDDGYGNGAGNITFEWVEQGDINNQKDLYYCGLSNTLT